MQVTSDRICFVALLWIGLFGLSALSAAEKESSSETFRYLRKSDSGYLQEFEIQLRRSPQRFVIRSATQRGRQRLTITSQFNLKNVLLSAQVEIRSGENVQVATVANSKGTARIDRDGNGSVQLECPPGVIITSAPDWTDSFLAVRRYDPNGKRTQEFPGLWVHPTRAPLRLTLKLSHLGDDEVQLVADGPTTSDQRQLSSASRNPRGQRDAFGASNAAAATTNRLQLRKTTRKLSRYLLILRGGSRYVVWCDQQRRLVRLMPAANPSAGIVLAGWQQATRNLKPRLSRN